MEDPMKALMTLFCLVIAMFMASCFVEDDIFVPAPSYYGSINADGSDHRPNDHRVFQEGMKSYYLADSLIIYLGTGDYYNYGNYGIYKKHISEYNAQRIPLDGLNQFSNNDLAISYPNNRMFFSAKHSSLNRFNIYSCYLDGSDLRNHTQHLDINITNPILSYGDVYITGVADSLILRGNLYTEEIIQIPTPETPFLAIYDPPSDKYYYIVKNYYDVKLYQYHNGVHSLLLESGWGATRLCYGYQGQTILAHFGSNNNLYTINPQTGEIQNHGWVDTFAVSQSENALFISTDHRGVSDIRKYYPDTQAHELFFEGIINRYEYNGFTREIALRADGQKLFYHGALSKRK